MQHISGQSQHRWVEYTIFANNFNAALITVLVLGADSGASGPAPWLRLGLRRLWWCSGGFCNNDLEFNCIRMPLRTLTLQASPPLDSWIESPSSRLGKFQQNLHAIVYYLPPPPPPLPPPPSSSSSSSPGVIVNRMSLSSADARTGPLAQNSITS